MKDDSSHHLQKVLQAQFSLYVYKMNVYENKADNLVCTSVEMNIKGTMFAREPCVN